MAIKTITRIAAIAATIGIAGLPLAISAPASAITKPEPVANINPPSIRTEDGSFNLDLTQIGAGTLGGIAVTGAGFAAVARLRRNAAQ
jgi:hypothetical protein